MISITRPLLFLLVGTLAIVYAVDADTDSKRSPLGTMRFGKRFVDQLDDDAINYDDGNVDAFADQHYFKVKKSADQYTRASDLIRDVRSPLGTMRFGKRSDSPLGPMRFGKRGEYEPNVQKRSGTDSSEVSPLGPMRFGKRGEQSPLGPMRFGKKSGLEDVMRYGDLKMEPFETMKFGKRTIIPIAVNGFGPVAGPVASMRYGKRFGLRFLESQGIETRD